MELGPNVNVLEDGERTIYLIGTAHISERSVVEVRQTIEQVRPDTVGFHTWAVSIPTPEGDEAKKGGRALVTSDADIIGDLQNADCTCRSVLRQRVDATLLASASTPTLRFLALQRTGPGALVLDRQFVQLSPDQILVVDFATGAEHGIETLWTASPDLSFRKTDATTVESSADMRGRHLKIQTAGDPTPELRIARGETVPFSGWVVVHRHPRSAPSLEAFQPGPESVKATLFTLQQKGTAENSATPTIAPGARPEAWSLTLDSGNSTHLRLTRQGRSLVLEDTANGSQNTVPLDTPAPLASRQAALRTAMTDAIAQYPQWRNLKHYRIKMTYLVLALFALLEIAYLIVNWRTGGWRPTKAIHITIVAGWTCAALWMHGVYFGG